MTANTARLPSSWVWLLGLFTVSSLIEVMFWGQMGAFTPLYLPSLGVRPQDVAVWTGIIAAVSSAIGVPFMPLWGAWADRYSRQPMIVRSFVVHIIAGLIAILAGNVWMFLIARSVQSFSLGNSGLMMTTLQERAPANRLGFAFSVMNGAGPLGAFVGPLVGGPVVDVWGFKALMAIDLVPLACIALLLTFGYHDEYRALSRAPVLRLAFGSIAIIGRSPRLRILFPALFLLFAGWMLAFTYLPLAVTSLYHGSEQGRAVGLVLGIGGLATLTLTPIMGVLADRYGHWRMLFIGASAAVVLWPLPALTSDLVSFTVFWTVLTGVVSSTFTLSFNVLSASSPTHARGRIMSLSFLPVNMGFVVGPAIGSVITRNSVFTVFPTAAVVTAAGLITLLSAYRAPLNTSADETG